MAGFPYDVIPGQRPATPPPELQAGPPANESRVPGPGPLATFQKSLAWLVRAFNVQAPSGPQRIRVDQVVPAIDVMQGGWAFATTPRQTTLSIAGPTGGASVATFQNPSAGGTFGDPDPMLWRITPAAIVHTAGAGAVTVAVGMSVIGAVVVTPPWDAATKIVTLTERSLAANASDGPDVIQAAGPWWVPPGWELHLAAEAALAGGEEVTLQLIVQRFPITFPVPQG